MRSIAGGVATPGGDGVRYSPISPWISATIPRQPGLTNGSAGPGGTAPLALDPGLRVGLLHGFRRLGRLPLGGGQLQVGLEVPIPETQQRLSGFDPVPFVDVQFGDLAPEIGGQPAAAAGLDAADPGIGDGLFHRTEGGPVNPHRDRLRTVTVPEEQQEGQQAENRDGETKRPCRHGFMVI